VSAKKLCGWGEDDFGDGKIHGDMDFDPQGNTWALTYFGPVPKKEEWDTVYRGSWLIHYNCLTGKAENLGIPSRRGELALPQLRLRQNLFFGVSHSGNDIVVYDTKEHRMIYGGAPATASSGTPAAS